MTAAAQMRRYAVLDVFTATPLLGNPLAVVIDADGLSDAQMAACARWTNLSETTPGCGCRSGEIGRASCRERV